ncbi:MAG: hypothetical protein RSA04_06980, partial [Clostridiales bacterium]
AIFSAPNCLITVYDNEDKNRVEIEKCFLEIYDKIPKKLCLFSLFSPKKLRKNLFALYKPTQKMTRFKYKLY